MNPDIPSALWRPSISFCIITNGKKPEHLKRELASIRALQIEDYEIIVCGRPPATLDGARSLALGDAADNGRLGAMRNRACSAATKELLVVADDDLIFQEDFYQGICSYGSDFDLLPCRLLNTDGSRYWDWAVHNLAKQDHHLIPYDQSSPDVYVTGGLSIMKQEVFRVVQWDEARGFYCEEDVDFSRRVKDAGFRILFNCGSTVVHDDDTYTQIDNQVTKLPYPFPRLEIRAGVFAQGLFADGAQSYWAAKEAKFEFAASSQPITVSLDLSPNCPISDYREGVLTVSFTSGGVTLGSLTFAKPEDRYSITLEIAPGSTDLFLHCSSVAVPALRGIYKERKYFGVKLRNIEFFAVPQSCEPIGIREDPADEQVLVLASLYNSGELSRALREQFLQSQTSARPSVGLLKNDVTIATNLAPHARDFAGDLAPLPRKISACIAVHDGGFELGTNLFRRRPGAWNRSVFVGPCSAINREVVLEVLTGNMDVGVFSSEDRAELLALGLDENQVHVVPLLPLIRSEQLPEKSPASGIHILLPLVFDDTTPLGEIFRALKPAIISQPSVTFHIWTRDANQKAALLEEWSKALKPELLAPESRIYVYAGTLPDGILERIINHMTLAVCLGEADPYGYIVRDLLARRVPVVGREIGARKDLPRSSGFRPVRDLRLVSEGVSEILSNTEAWRKQCEEYRNLLKEGQTTLEHLLMLAHGNQQ